jgi:flavodoxin
MKSLVAYYSLNGHTRLIAEMIADLLNADLLELHHKKSVPAEGFMKFVLGGAGVVFRAKPKLLSKIPDLKGYDSIFIGTPVWASGFAPAIRSFLSAAGIQNKSLALFACHAGGSGEKCFNKLKEALYGNSVAGTIDFQDPKPENRDLYENKLITWLSRMNALPQASE